MNPEVIEIVKEYKENIQNLIADLEVKLSKFDISPKMEIEVFENPRADKNIQYHNFLHIKLTKIY